MIIKNWGVVGVTPVVENQVFIKCPRFEVLGNFFDYSCDDSSMFE